MSWLLIVGPVSAGALLTAAKGALDRAGAEKGSAIIARATFCTVVAVGFGVWVAIPWIDILVHSLRN
ncbi:MAG TPA: hypothetical protein VF819_07090 [Nitrospira sp.]